MHLPSILVISYSIIAHILIACYQMPFFIITPILPLVWGLHRFSLSQLLLLAFTLGFALDIFSSHLPIGTYGLSFFLASLILKYFEKAFYEDKILAFALYATLFSFLFSIALFILHLMNHQMLHLSIQFIFTEWVVSSFIDAGFCLFSLFFLSMLYSAYQWVTTRFKLRMKRLRGY